jgi:hypothetical protein
LHVKHAAIEILRTGSKCAICDAAEVKCLHLHVNFREILQNVFGRKVRFGALEIFLLLKSLKITLKN